ncbi:MAG: nucleotidyltransferase domain-containing protein [Deltaproteobacteria bacterium]|nr:nucleotidyltransferase domain-containing protein [Deltaproteobacteria bacterium]
MGKLASRRSLAGALFSSTQARLLALLFGQPDRSFFTSEIITDVKAGSGAVQRQLKRLTEAGLVTVSRVGRQTHYRANTASPIFAELSSIVRKTVGVAEPLREALAPLADRLDLALVYGSVAKGTDRSESDIDLMLVSHDLSLEEVYRALADTETALGREIRPMLYTPDELDRRLGKSAFVKRVLAGDTIVLIGEIPVGHS